MDRRRPGEMRVPVGLPIVVELHAPAGQPIRGEIQNLSRSGARLQVEQAGQPRAAVWLTVRLRPPASLTLAGTVVWSHPSATHPGWVQGIQFRAVLPGELVARLTGDPIPPQNVPPTWNAAGVTASDAPPFRGVLVGAVLGVALWMGAGTAFLYAAGFLSHVPTSLWWGGLGCLVSCATVELARIFLPRRPAMVAPPPIPRRSAG